MVNGFAQWQFKKVGEDWLFLLLQPLFSVFKLATVWSRAFVFHLQTAACFLEGLEASVFILATS